jgi:hypothetical protein
MWSGLVLDAAVFGARGGKRTTIYASVVVMVILDVTLCDSI